MANYLVPGTYATVDLAIAAAVTGADQAGIVIVSAGTYNMGINFTQWGGGRTAPLTVRAADPSNPPVFDGTGLGDIGQAVRASSANVLGATERPTLENLVFARDFVMGVNQGRVIAVPHSKLKIRSFAPGKAALSKRTFSSWLKSITGLWIGVTANGQTKQSRLLGAQRGLVILRESIIAIETVDSIAIGAVDNSLTD